MNSAEEAGPPSPTRKRLAIVGSGSSGLITLKYALDLLPAWDIECFEQSSRITGVWGNPYPGFVSTSTKYTTQFACYPKFDASVEPDGGASRSEFFRDGEYGEYLEEFASKFSLRRHIKLETRVESVRRDLQSGGWNLSIVQMGDGRSAASQKHFDAVIICTGLAAEPKQIDCKIPTLSVADLTRPEGLGHIRNKRIVVAGGGESAVDYANRLSRTEHENEVYLSLRTGIRVSPRYHPIRGVPSDFLRNRLMLSIHDDIRNWIGQRFVELRIRHQERFEWFFPHRGSKRERAGDAETQISARRKDWAYRLTKAAKDDLFDMFHNKSDDFLDAVGEQRITIVGPPLDSAWSRFRAFDSSDEITVEPDLVVPAIGYRSQLEQLSGGEFCLADFHWGCCHVGFPDLFLVGFARPIIGNIPSMSEMQARYACGLVAGVINRPTNIEQLHAHEQAHRQVRFQSLDLSNIYPVEMFPYCDELARQMNAYPSVREFGLLSAWWRAQLAPATTLHYQIADGQARRECKSAPVYMPMSLIVLLLGLKPVDWVYRLFRR